jgi:hypothetical protein
VPTAELLVHQGDTEIPVFMLRQVAENVIQISGSARSSLLVHFGATKDIEVSPLPKVHDFVECIVSNVPEELREQIAGFYMSVFSGVLRAGHGTLAAVLAAKRLTVPKAFRDGVIFSPPIDIAEKIREMLKKRDTTSNAKLQASSALITGMLLSDGITIFGSDGKVRAYNVFVKHPKKRADALGGARTRTFNVMRDLVGKDLVGALIRSQDGRVDSHGKTK